MSKIPSSSDERPNPFKSAGREIRKADRALADGWSIAGITFRNALKRLRRASLDYVVLPIGGSLPELSGPPRSFFERRLPLPPDPLSLQQLNAIVRMVADADNTRGIVFIFRGFNAGLATLQNFRAAVARLRAAGKEVIVYTPYMDLAHYYAASAADRIVVPPGTRFELLGLYTDVTFLKDALGRFGLSAEVVQISPYKTAFDRFSRSEMTPEHRQQLDWLLDDQYDMLTDDIATARGMSQPALKELIDRAPFSAQVALEHGLVDHVAYDDQLANWLAAQQDARITNDRSASGEKIASPKAPPAVSLKTWRQAREILPERPRRYPRQYIGVISLEGLITMGAGRRSPIDLPIPFLGGAVAGEQTLVGLLRRVEKYEDMAALVLHVDSGGGSALASELIGRQVEMLAAKKPVVIYMGNVAASGGYYVSALAQHIMSQRATLTGSIGVIVARLSPEGLFERLSVNQTSLQRGDHAGLYNDPAPWSEEERDIFRQTVVETYEEFKAIVARGRNLTSEQVDEIGLGRVWTGRQAAERQLVDSHGDLLDAIKKAAELAALPNDDIYGIPVYNFFAASSRYVIPSAQTARIAEELGRLLKGDQLHELNGRPLMLLPYNLRFR